MFYSFSLRPLRWWLVGLLAGLVGWAIWTGLERSPGGRLPLAFERQFWPERPAMAPPAGQERQGPQPEGPSRRAAGPAAVEPTLSGAMESAASLPGQPAATPAEQPVAPQGAGRLEADGFRAQRERLRSQEMELARQVLEDPSAPDVQRTQARAELLELLQRSRKEMEIEELLRAAGVPDSVVSIGDAGVQVVVPTLLSAQGAARIGDLVARMAGVRRETISIMDSWTAFGEPAIREESPPQR